MNTYCRQRVYKQCVFVFLACTLFSCTHEDFFTYEPPPSPEMDPRVEFELSEQWEGGKSQSFNYTLDVLPKAELRVDIPDSCPAGGKQISFTKTILSGGRLDLVLYTQSGFPIGFYQELSDADPCDEVGPFFEIFYDIPSVSDSAPPFISSGQGGTVEVIHTFHPTPEVSFTTDLFRVQYGVVEADTIKLNVTGRVYTNTLALN